MYLKSLTLKGFKSFADKTQMVFDPGLTVVVGPNGSGKSNVSDAILWVLGEQSAKMLRGQAMEDVIFSGSSARGAVGVAEVTLVLDNSDHTIPIDFSEIGITRRMYRSGESEYLINGAPSRLMDIQDILHDSGLGKDTHSIISQGKLDSILSSRPEQRRELIEEAADISKHRRRKERAERKISSMDENLTRAKVVSREITRQLKPLERQVDKASRAKDLSAQLKDLTVQLAVDDLRQLQFTHGKLEARAKEAEAAIELAQYRAGEKNRELEKLQSLLEQKGLFVGDLGEQRRRMQEILGRMGSDMRLLEEKGKNMVSRLSDTRMQLSVMDKQKADAAKENEELSGQLATIRAKVADLTESVNALQEAANQAIAERRALDVKISDCTASERSARNTADKETLAYVKLEEQIAHAQVEDKMFESRLTQITEALEIARAALEDSGAKEAELTAALEKARQESEAFVAEISERASALEAAREAERTARQELSSSEATLEALRALDVEVQKGSPLVEKLVADAATASLVSGRLADYLEVQPEFEALVEQLLGEDLSALVVDKQQNIQTLFERVQTLSEDGKATLVALSDATPALAAPAHTTSLLELVSAQKGAEALVQALFGHVFVAQSLNDAYAARKVEPRGLYALPDGTLLYPDGRLVLGHASQAEDGSLERKRRIRELEDTLPALKLHLEAARSAVTNCENELASVREKSAQSKGEVARLNGELTSIAAERGRLEGQVASSQAELKQVSTSREQAKERAQEARAHIDEHKRAAEEAKASMESLASELKELQDQHEDAIRAQGRANRELSDAKTDLTVAKERATSMASRQAELERRLSQLDEQLAAAKQATHALEVIRLRVDPLYKRYDALHQKALEWASRLKDRASLAEADSETLRATISEAKDAASEAALAVEKEKDAANQISVEIGKLEVQVQNAIEAILATGASLDEALTLPEPEDREQAERLAASLKSQLEALGPVNAVAMDEYERLKERADYINEQVADLEAARTSLKKIISAIDRKMRSRFLVVFDRVNQNFSEIFSMLFPGGHAHIELTDPDHLSETGIEIVAQPRGKRITKMMLMSGGEKSLTALALLFAVYRTRTVPFYVFDEVEAALDDANLSKLLDAIEQLKETTQLIVISHQRRTMEQADVLYGVSMQADGVSHVVSQRLDKTTGKVVDI